MLILDGIWHPLPSLLEFFLLESLDPLFPGRNWEVQWTVAIHNDGTNLFDQYFSNRVMDKGKVMRKMQDWAASGWGTHVGYIKQLSAERLPFMVWEVKNHQDRVLFTRSGNMAIIYDAFQKKDDWSKRDEHFLRASAERAIQNIPELASLAKKSNYKTARMQG